MVSPLGLDIESSWKALLDGVPGGGPITLFDAHEGFATRIACEVKDFDPLQHMDRKEARRYDRFAQLALAAADQAMAAAGLDGPPPVATRRPSEPSLEAESVESTPSRRTARPSWPKGLDE